MIENYEDGPLELYDLEVDPSERCDLSESQPERVVELYGMLNVWKEETGAALPLAK